jgi:hypothetical protein
MMFEQAAIAVQDEQGYAGLHARIDAAFGTQDVEVFLGRVGRSKLRIRDFAEQLYQALPVSDQALTRERYLQHVEAVPRELRERYMKVYAYY